MEKIPLDRLADVATVIALPISKAQRLSRWRDLLLMEGERMLRPLLHLEFRAPADRAECRADNSPLALAFADPVLRAAGLAGDRVADAEAFFGLSARETHYLLCDCHYLGTMSASRVGRRVHALAQTNFLARTWLMLTAA